TAGFHPARAGGTSFDFAQDRLSPYVVCGKNWQPLGASLEMHVRTLTGILAVRWRALHYLNFELYRKLFGGIASRIVASLVLQFSTNHVFRGHDTGQWAYFDSHRNFARVDTQLFVGRESEAHLLGRRIADSPDHDVSGSAQLERSRN